MKFEVIVLCICSVAVNLCLSIVSPYLPQEAIQKGLTITKYEMTFAAFSLSRLLFGSIWARWMNTDKLGSKFLFVTGLFTVGYVTILLGLLDFGPGGLTFLVICILLRIVTAIGATAFNMSIYAIVQQQFTTQTGFAFGIIEVTASISYIIALPVAGYLHKIGGFYFPFVIYGGIALFVFLCTFYFIPDCPPLSDRAHGYAAFLKHIAILIGLFLVISQRMTGTFMNTLLEIDILKLKGNYVIVGVVFSANKVAYMIAVVTVGVILDKTVWRNPLTYSPFSNELCGVAPLLYAFILACGENWWLNAVALVISCGILLKFIALLLWTSPYVLPGQQSLTQVTILVIISGIADAFLLNGSFTMLKMTALVAGFSENMKTYSVISSCYNIAIYIGSVFGAILGGVLVDYFGGIPQASFIISCVFGVLLLMCPVCLIDVARFKASPPEQVSDIRRNSIRNTYGQLSPDVKEVIVEEERVSSTESFDIERAEDGDMNAA